VPRAYHVIFGTYGFWLPNDPRGSWSTFVGSWELHRFGKATKTIETDSLAHQPHDIRRRMAAKHFLKSPPVVLEGADALVASEGFKRAFAESSRTCVACSILPQHVHLILGETERPINQVISHLKARATNRLREARHWPDDRPIWARGSWRVFLDSDDQIATAIAYVEANPEKEGKPPQRWSFVRKWTP